MRTTLFALISTFTLSTFPLLAYADITVVNNTDSYATASVGSSPCSADKGNDGIAYPHGTLNIPQIVFPIFCGVSTSCTGHVYMTNNCGNSGPEVATVTINAVKGEITNYTNHDKEHYAFTISSKNITINPVQQKSWFKLLF
jgi:hypothetical protein